MESFSEEMLEHLSKVVPQRCKCELCFNVLMAPVQTTRGNSACKPCYFNAKKDEICPIDKQPIEPNEIFPDKAKWREIMNLVVECIYKNKGCKWSGKIKQIQVHLLSCTFADTICDFCGERQTNQKKKDHFLKCEGIYKEGNCLFQNVGCSFMASTKDEMTKHVEKDAFLHSLLQATFISKIPKFQEEAKQLKNELATEKTKRCQLETRVNQLQVDLENQDVKHEFFKQKCMEQFAAFRNEMVQLQEQKCTTQTNAVDDVTRNSIKTVKNTVQKISKDIEDLDLRLQLHQNSTYHGRILWKINDYQHRQQQAVTGSITALHSAPSFSSEHGYKFCLRLYLNGDGMGRGTHLSLFLVIMKSEYDNVLEWPFTEKVKFTLINQQNRNDDIVEKMVPNKDSSSFQKPRKEMNIASGIPLFVEIDRLEREGFMKDDSLFVEMLLE